jgi:hypothetical protein
MLDSASSQSAGIANCATGTFTGDGTICEVNLGFKPRYVKLINLTDRIVNEISDTMAATQTLKTVAAGTMTLDTDTDLLLVDGISDDFRGFQVSAAVNIAAKVFHYIAIG